MKPTFVIIGQSPAAYAAIKTLRGGNADWDITLISTDGQLPYDRSRFPEFINRAVKETAVFCAPETFYRDNGVKLILDKELSRINFNRNKLYLADKLQVNYDALLLTDVPQVRLPEVKGMRRQGVFHLARLDGVRRIIKQLTFVETVVVMASTPRGIATALALKQAGKEVVLILDHEDGTDVSGLRVIVNNPVEDIIGEGEVQAVRFRSGKVMACEMVIVEDVQPDMRFLTDSGLVIQERICVHSTLRSNFNAVYAADVLMELSSPKYVGTYSLDTDQLIRQGECVAGLILGNDQPFVPVLADLVTKADTNALVEVIH